MDLQEFVSRLIMENALIAFIILSVPIAILWSRFGQLERRFLRLEQSLVERNDGEAQVSSSPSLSTKPLGIVAVPPNRTTVEAKVSEGAAKVLMDPIKPEAPEPGIPIQRKKSAIWSKWEKQFLENWTGVVGSAVLVLGVIFIGVYAALKLTPIFRFSIIVVVSAALFALSLYLKRKDALAQLGQWIASSAAAIFLFSCFASSGIPGLKWIDNEIAALSLLSVGIVFNFVIAYLAQRQGFLSLHTVLCLLSLIFAPSDTTLIVSSAVVLGSILFTFRNRWDVHLLISIISFFFFFVVWYLQNEFIEPHSRLIGLTSVLLVGLTSGLVHYRKDYASSKIELLPFIVHILNWMFVGMGLLSLSTQSPLTTLPIAVGSLAAFGLARYARFKQISWVYRTDTLLGQVLAIFALYSLNNWGLDALSILGLVAAQAFLFTFIMFRENDDVLAAIGIRISQIAVVLFTAMAFTWHLISDDWQMEKTLATVVGVFGAALAYKAFIVKQYGEHTDALVSGMRPPVSVVGFILPTLALVAYSVVVERNWAELLVVGVLTCLLWLRQRFQLNGLGLGISLSAGILLILNWSYLNSANTIDAPFYLGVMPIFVLFAPLYAWSYVTSLARSFRPMVIYAIGLHVVIASIFIGGFYSNLLPGLIWLLLSVVCLELSQALAARDNHENGAPAWHILNVAYVFVGLFVLQYFVIDLQIETYLWLFKTRTWIGLFAVLVFAYWSLSRKREKALEHFGWVYLNPLYLELVLLFGVVNALIIIPNVWSAVFWGAFAIVILLVGKKAPISISRLRFYSMILFWLSGAYLAGMTSTLETASLKWHDQPAILGALALAVQIAYIVLVHNPYSLKGIEFPETLRNVAKLSTWIDKQKYLFVYYPFFATTTVFLYWRFSSAILTLLWVAECFVIFGLSIFLRVPQFRLVALATLGACLVRLVLFDMRNTDLVLRGVVFVGVGALMLGMNYLYRRFKPEDE